MKLRVFVSLVGLAFLFSAAAQAQERQTIDVFAGYSYVRANPSTTGINSFSLNGGSGSVAYNFNNWLAGVADFGGYNNSSVLGSGVNSTLSTYLFGPRVSFRRFNHVTPFAEVLFGVAHTDTRFLSGSSSQTPFAMTVGGGFDYRLTNHLSWRAAKVDYLLTRFSELNTSAQQTQNNLRVSTGIVFRF